MAETVIEQEFQTIENGFGVFVVKSFGVNIKLKQPNGSEKTGWLTLESPDLEPVRVAVPVDLNNSNATQPEHTLTMSELSDAVALLVKHVTAGLNNN